MKLSTTLLLATTTTALLLSFDSASAQPRRGAGRGLGVAVSPSSTAQEALVQALTGPDGEYAALAEYTAIVQKYGQVLPYASILRSEERHVAALKRHLELRNLAVPENTYMGKVQAPASLKEAAEAGVAAEQRNVAMYETLLAKVKEQPDLVQVFTQLQMASRDRHLVAFKAAAEKGGELAAGDVGCGLGCGKGGCGMGQGNCGLGMGGRQGRGGRPAWAGQGGCQGGGCAMSQQTGAAGQQGAGTKARRGYSYGAAAQSQAQ